jgi:hypothetical protein
LRISNKQASRCSEGYCSSRQRHLAPQGLDKYLIRQSVTAGANRKTDRLPIRLRDIDI